MKNSLILSIAILLIACNDRFPQKPKVDNLASFESVQILATYTDSTPTPLPIRLEQLSEEQRKIIQEGHDVDTSSYLMESRPIVFQIQGVENNQDQSRQGGRMHYLTEVFIYSLVEASDTTLVDYGWIKNEHGEMVWKTEYSSSVRAGGDARNRKVVQKAILPPGHYSLHFKSNSSHANGDWQGDPPEYPFYYGITVFNLKAIDTINRKFED